MTQGKCVKFCQTLLLLLLCPWIAHAAPAPDSIAIHYGANPPLEELAQFDWIVLEPRHHLQQELPRLKGGGKPLAYLSIGEVGDDAIDAADTNAWRIGRNTAWNSSLMNLADKGWQDALLKRAHALRDEGYQGLFLDTLDSFQLLPEQQRVAQLQGLVDILDRLHNELPQLHLLFNRGFEAIERLDWVPELVAFESLYAGWDPAQNQYREVTPEDRDWLLQKLLPLREKGSILLALEYLPPQRRDEARQLAQQIRQEGFIPWISTPEQNYLGIGSIEVLPRRLLVLYDPREGEMSYSSGFSLLGSLLEYMGYRIDYLSIDQLPENIPTKGLYAGIIVWMTSGAPPNAAYFERWLLKHKRDSIPLAFIGDLPITGQTLLDELGLSIQTADIGHDLQITYQSEGLFGFEGPLRPQTRGLEAIQAAAGKIRPLLQVGSPGGAHWTPAGLADWGGYALNPYVLEAGGVEGYQRWTLNPFAFLQQALRLSPLPAPDSTTENGRRIATVHMDGDGFLSKTRTPGTPFAGEYMLEHFIERYPLLIDSSIIEGEIGPLGMYPQLSKRLEPVARKIFAHPRVEVASHSFSHPFFWQPGKVMRRENFDAHYGFHLEIPNYPKVDLHREIFGARDYINNTLTTRQKPAKLLFWTGDALPNEETLRLVNKAGLLNFNGGNTYLTYAFPSLTGLSPLVRPQGNQLQFYAPLMNENIYTNLWQGPFYGFRNLIDTFALTDSPRRLRPLSLYNHFYLVTQPGGVASLHQIYQNILAQNPLPLWISQYIERVQGAWLTSIARQPDGSYRILGRGLRTLRLPKALGWPDLQRSKQIAGVRDLPQGRYLHLSGEDAVLYLRPERDKRPSLEEANLPLTQWQSLDAQRVRLGFAGEFPLRFSVRAEGVCRLHYAGKNHEAQRDKDLQYFSLAERQLNDALLVCQ